MSLLEVNQLSRAYRDVLAVDNVTFSLEAGTVLGFIGPNGAGKSTVLRIVSTLDVPTSGSVTVAGYSASSQPDQVRPLVGYMPDRYGTYDNTTVREFLDFFARAYGLRGAIRRTRVDAVIDFTGLSPLTNRLTQTLSKGMKQRVALARALIHDPALLILDEPADGLDPRARIELRELLRALAAQGKAILISSHILTELAEVCDRCAIVEKGKLLAFGSVAEVLSSAKDTQPTASLELRFHPATGQLAETLKRAERLLLEQPLVTSVTATAQGLTVNLSSETLSSRLPTWVDAASVRLLAVLVRADFPVSACSQRQADLEDAFLAVTKGVA